MYKRGTVYLANLNPYKGAEPGKIRPVLVLQNDLLNDAGHTTVIVLPITTNLIDQTEPLRFRINKREQLEKDSDILCDQIRAVDVKRLIPERIAELDEYEMFAVEEQIGILLDFSSSGKGFAASD